MNKLFVYGTLKKGHSNHARFLSQAKYIGEGTTTRDIWALYDLGFFPAMTYGTMQVSGEVYEVTDYELGKIDMLEGAPDLYQRHKIIVGVDGNEHHCHTYLMFGNEFHAGQHGNPMARWTWPLEGDE